MKTNSLLKISIISIALGTLASCTNAPTRVGNVSTYYDGTITSLELVEVDSNKYNSTGNTFLGAIGGALLGGLVSDHSSGALVGGALGGLAGAGGSYLGNRSEGVRMTVKTSNGPTIVDTYFNCQLKIGRKVRLLSGSNNGEVQIYYNGAYKTITAQTQADCPSTYNLIKKGSTIND